MTTYLDFAAIPRHRYQVILVDPPWRFEPWSAKGLDRSAEMHYRTLAFDELAAFPVASLAASRCALFLWTVRSHLPIAQDLIEAWGFEFKSTGFVWAKTCRAQPDKFRIGNGKSGTRSGVEQCWLATPRRLPARKSASVRELIIAPIGRHSEKPDRAYSDIEQLFDGPYIELFARNTRPGWDAWGDDPSLVGFTQDSAAIAAE